MPADRRVSAAGPDYSWPHTGLLRMARLKDDTHKSESSKDDTHNREVYRIIETHIYVLPFNCTVQKVLPHCPLPVFKLVAELVASLAAMGSEGSGGKPFWSDHEITVDRDGIPHYTGASPSLMKEYTRRVRFAYGGLEGEGKDAEAEAADLEKKQCRFARRLVDALHGEAWRAVEHLVMQPEKLRKKDGFEEVLLALGTIEKEGVIRKTEAFDKFFESTRRARGEAIDAYLRRKNQAWRDLRDLDESSAMSEDLLSYFVLKGCGLTREDRRSILLANKSKYDQAGIEQSLRVFSFHDMHEKEKTGGGGWQDRKRSGPKKRYYANEVIDEEFPEDEQTDQAYYQYESEYDEVSEQAYYQEEDGDGAAGPGSDAGASGDDDVYEAYAAMDKTRQTYKDARKRLRDVQKSRGFYRGGSAWPSRDQAKEKEKARSRCAACGALGHWAGDHNCPKTSAHAGPKKGRGKSKGGSKGKKSSKGVYAAAPHPMFFSLDDPDGDDAEEVHSYMLRSDPAEEDEMLQDAGYTFTDDRRKPATGARGSYAEGPGGLSLSAPMPTLERPVEGREFEVWTPDGPWDETTTQGRFVEETQEVIKPTMLAKVEIREVSSFREVRPAGMDKMKSYELQALCEKWGIQTGGARKDLLQRLEDLFRGHEVPKKRCTVQFVKLVEEEPVIRDAAAAASFAVEPGGVRPCPQRGSPGAASYVPPTPKYSSSSVYSSQPPSVAQTPEAKRASRPTGRSIVATDLEVGRALDDLRCCDCGAAMVARQNRADGELFFSFSRWPSTKCGFTRPLQDGLDILNRQIMDVRYPRSPAASRGSAGH